MNSDTSSRFIGSKFDIHLIVLSSAAWLAHEMHSDTIPIFSAKGFETGICCAAITHDVNWLYIPS